MQGPVCWDASALDPVPGVDIPGCSFNVRMNQDRSCRCSRYVSACPGQRPRHQQRPQNSPGAADELACAARLAQRILVFPRLLWFYYGDTLPFTPILVVLGHSFAKGAGQACLDVAFGQVVSRARRALGHPSPMV